MEIEGERSKRLRLFRVNNNGAAHGEPVFEADKDTQMKAYRRRRDWRYRLMVDGKMLSIAETALWMS